MRSARDPGESPGLSSRYLPTAAATEGHERLERSGEQLTVQVVMVQGGSEIQPETRHETQPRNLGDVEGLPRPPTRHAPLAEEDEGEMVAALRRYPRIPREAEHRPQRWAPHEAGEHPLVTGKVICHRCGHEGHIAYGCRSRTSAPGTTSRVPQPRAAAVLPHASADTSNT
ncbi:unnamed protein product [Lampetra planeri]